jgi:hypothetical protein
MCEAIQLDQQLGLREAIGTVVCHFCQKVQVLIGADILLFQPLRSWPVQAFPVEVLELPDAARTDEKRRFVKEGLLYHLIASPSADVEGQTEVKRIFGDVFDAFCCACDVG